MTVPAVKVFLLSNLVLAHFVKGKNLVLKSCDNCHDGVDYPSPMFSSYVTKNGVQYITANVTFSEDFGDNIMVNMKLFHITAGNRKRKIFEADEKFCKMIRTYVGPSMYEIQKASQIIPGACPILKGKYHLKDFPLNINKILIKEVIPYGTLKFIAHHVNTKTKEALMCYEADVEVF